MIRSEVEDFIRETLGRRGTDLRQQIIQCMNLAKTEMEKSPELPWFLLQTWQTLALADAANTIALPTGYIRCYEEEENMYVATDDTTLPYRVVPKRPYDQIKVRYVTAGSPQAYALLGTQFWIAPISDQAYTLYHHYYKGVDDYVSGTDGTDAWLTNAPDVIIAKAGMRMATRLRDAKARKMFAEDLGLALGRMWDEDTARREAGLIPFIGEEI